MSIPTTTNTKTRNGPRKLKRANDAMDAAGAAAPAVLFDEFWREGELALLFGKAGVGKSLLAVGIADALARGRPIEGLEMPAFGRNVLYVDLVLSDGQFKYRYSRPVRGNTRRKYKFSARFFRDRPEEGDEFAVWLREIVAEHKIAVVVIDDLSMIARGDDSTRDTLELVDEMKKMIRELGISVLMLADSLPSVGGRAASERDLRRTRILCSYADSVFALDTYGRGECDRRNLVQIRSQSGSLVWTHRQPCRFVLAEREDGFVGFEYREPELSDEDEALIINIKWLYETGGTYRTIADRLGMSKSTVERLHKKWSPRLGPPPDANGEDEYGDSDLPEEAYFGENTDNYMMSIGMEPVFWKKHQAALQAMSESVEPSGEPEAVKGFDPSRIPFAAALGMRSILDLERDIDQDENEIFIESRNEYTGRPQVWYMRRSNGDFARWERNIFGNSGTTHGPSPYLPRKIKLPRRKPRIAAPIRANAARAP